jgi:DNA-binding HxlR family transcriptional regulator
MHAYTLSIAYPIVEYKAALPSKQVTARLETRGGKAAFSSLSGNRRRNIVETLEIALKPLSLKEIADTIKMPKSTVRDKANALLRHGVIQRVSLLNNGRKTHYYSIAKTRDLNSIWRTRCFVWQHCPLCGAKRRLRRQPTGEYLRWCRCGAKSELISQERIKA